MKLAFPTDLQNTIQARGVVAVLIIDEVKHAVPVARALLRGGIASMELTLRTPRLWTAFVPSVRRCLKC